MAEAVMADSIRGVALFRTLSFVNFFCSDYEILRDISYVEL